MTRALHWVMAAGIFVALGLGLAMVRLPGASEEDISRVLTAYSVHKTLGIALLGMAILRAAWRLSHCAPGPLHPERYAETLLAQAVHAALWSAMVILPVTGWLHHSAAPGFSPIQWHFGQSLPFVPAEEGLALVFRSVHAVSGWLLVGAVVLHVSGVAKHVLIDRDATLTRMVNGKGPAVPPKNPATPLRLSPT